MDTVLKVRYKKRLGWRGVKRRIFECLLSPRIVWPPPSLPLLPTKRSVKWFAGFKILFENFSLQTSRGATQRDGLRKCFETSLYFLFVQSIRKRQVRWIQYFFLFLWNSLQGLRSRFNRYGNYTVTIMPTKRPMIADDIFDGINFKLQNSYWRATYVRKRTFSAPSTWGDKKE